MVPHAPEGLPAPFVVDAEAACIKIIRDKPSLAQFELPLDTHNWVNNVFVVRKVVRREFLRERSGGVQRGVGVKAYIAYTREYIKLYALATIQGICRGSLKDPSLNAGVRRDIQPALRSVRKGHLSVAVRERNIHYVCEKGPVSLLQFHGDQCCKTEITQIVRLAYAKVIACCTDSLQPIIDR